MWKKTLQQRPYVLLLVPAVILFICSFFTQGNSVDLHVSDTMYVVYTPHIYRVMAFVFSVAFLVYEGAHQLLKNKWLIWIHVLLTLLLLLSAFFYATHTFDGARVDAAVDMAGRYEQFQRMYGVFFCLLVTTQVLFLFNLIWGIVCALRKKRSR